MTHLELAERLDDEATRLHGRGIDRGCVDSSLSGNLAMEAALAIQSLSDRIAVLEDSVVSLWHDCPSEDRSLNECLALSWEQYQTWVKTASLTQEPN